MQIDYDVSGGFAETTSNGSQIRIYPLYTTSQACYVWNKKSGKYERQSNNWQPVPAEAAIHHMEGDTEVRDEGVADSVTSIITRYSPNGPDGKFNPAPYIHKYSGTDQVDKRINPKQKRGPRKFAEASAP